MAGEDEAVLANESFAFVLPGGHLLKGVIVMKKVLLVLALAFTMSSLSSDDDRPQRRQEAAPGSVQECNQRSTVPPGPLVRLR
jgi:hypothetical protein